MQTFTLNDGNKIPQLGLGFYLSESGEATVEYVKNGLKAGYRLLDTAAAYMNERSIAQGIRESGVPREEIFLTTKLWVQDYGYENATRAIDGALRRLDTDYLDLLLLHRPAGDNVGAYKAMEDAQKAGKIRSIGVCNHTVPQLTALMEQTTVVPAVNQMECHPLQQQKELRKLLAQHDIRLESWFPLGHGSKRLRFNEALNAIAEKNNKTIGQVILRWHLQEGFIAIPKSANPDHQKENLDIFDFRLSEEDMNTIRSLDAGRYLGGDPESPELFKKWQELRFELD